MVVIIMVIIIIIIMDIMRGIQGKGRGMDRGMGVGVGAVGGEVIVIRRVVGGDGNDYNRDGSWDRERVSLIWTMQRQEHERTRMICFS